MPNWTRYSDSADDLRLPTAHRIAQRSTDRVAHSFSCFETEDVTNVFASSHLNRTFGGGEVPSCGEMAMANAATGGPAESLPEEGCLVFKLQLATANNCLLQFIQRRQHSYLGTYLTFLANKSVGLSR